MKTKDTDIKDIVDQLSCPTGEEGVECSEKMNKSNEFMTNETLKRLKLNADSCILEIGPGSGFLSVPLFKKLGKDNSYIGIDHSDLMISELNTNLKGFEFEKMALKGSLESLNCPKRANICFAVNLIYFIDDLESFFTSLRVWLAPSAQVIFTQRSFETVKSLPHSKHGFNLYQEDYIAEILSKVGFKSITIDYIDEPKAQRQINTELTFESSIITFLNS